MAKVTQPGEEELGFGPGWSPELVLLPLATLPVAERVMGMRSPGGLTQHIRHGARPGGPKGQRKADGACSSAGPWVFLLELYAPC